jgi:hypothetical protein
MPAILLMIGAGIKYFMAYAIVRFMLAVGLSYVTYSGMDVLMSNMETQIQSLFGGLGGDLYAILAMMGADVGISIMFSAITIRLVLIGFQNGTKTGFKLTAGS